MGDKGGRRELVDGLMRSGIESHRHAVGSLDGKARGILTAGTIVLGIVMGGMGTVIGLGGAAGWGLPGGIHPFVAFAIAECVVGSLAAIFTSVCLAVRALKVVRVTGFGNAATFAEGRAEGADPGVIGDWVGATDDELYARVYDARAVELKSLEGQSLEMGQSVRWSQRSLVAGLALSLAWSAMLVAAWAAAHGGAA